MQDGVGEVQDGPKTVEDLWGVDRFRLRTFGVLAASGFDLWAMGFRSYPCSPLLFLPFLSSPSSAPLSPTSPHPPSVLLDPSAPWNDKASQASGVAGAGAPRQDRVAGVLAGAAGGEANAGAEAAGAGKRGAKHKAGAEDADGEPAKRASARSRRQRSRSSGDRLPTAETLRSQNR